MIFDDYCRNYNEILSFVDIKRSIELLDKLQKGKQS